MSTTLQVGHIWYLNNVLNNQIPIKPKISLHVTKEEENRAGFSVWKLVSVVIRAHFVPEREMANDDGDDGGAVKHDGSIHPDGCNGVNSKHRLGGRKK